jgi:hypothetical protein
MNFLPIIVLIALFGIICIAMAAFAIVSGLFQFMFGMI